MLRVKLNQNLSGNEYDKTYGTNIPVLEDNFLGGYFSQK